MHTTGSATIADLLPRAVELFDSRPAVRFKHDGAWCDVSYADVGETVQAIALGLIELGVEPGDRVCLLSETRPEWTYLDFAIAMVGAVVVSVYPTNSAEECEWVIGDSDAVAIVCEDAAQVAKVTQVRDRLPALRHVIAIDPPGDAGDVVTLDALRAGGRAEDLPELRRRTAAVTPEDPFTFMYTSGTTGPPKGCVLTHGNYRSIVNLLHGDGILEDDELVYLFLPLAHAYARLVQLVTFDAGMQIAYWTKDSKRIIPEIAEVRPTFLPAVPRIFEKLYAVVAGDLDAATVAEATEVGVQYRDQRFRGEVVSAELQQAYDAFDEQIFRRVRETFGGRIHEANTGSAPIATEILRFFWAAGIPVLDGYGMTETSTSATSMQGELPRFGTVGRPYPGVELRIAEDGEVLLRGPNIFAGYHKNPEATREALADGWLHTGDVGTVDADGYLTITGRKKDIIITAGGKNLTPANLENDLKQSPYVSQAVMHGDRRPYAVLLITLEEDEIVPWARAQGIADTSIPSLATEPAVVALIQSEVDRANARYAPVEQAKRFAILDHDLSVESGELTPTMKVKRNVVSARYAETLDALYR